MRQMMLRIEEEVGEEVEHSAEDGLEGVVQSSQENTQTTQNATGTVVGVPTRTEVGSWADAPVRYFREAVEHIQYRIDMYTKDGDGLTKIRSRKELKEPEFVIRMTRRRRTNPAIPEGSRQKGKEDEKYSSNDRADENSDGTVSELSNESTSQSN